MSRDAPGPTRHTTVACEQCKGTGRRVLTYIEAVTLGALRSEWSTTKVILTRLNHGAVGDPLSPTALANRLVDLEYLGVAEFRWAKTNRRLKEWRRLR